MNLTKIDSCIYKNSQELQDLKKDLSEAVLMSRGMVSLLKKAGLSRSHYYRRVYSGKLSQETLTKLIRAIVAERNEMIIKINMQDNGAS